ncbi:MAG: hypothetical protein V2A56_05150 [bacterium]
MTRHKKVITAAVVILILAAAMITTGARTRERTINFIHPLHVEENGLSCDECHAGVMILATGKMAIPNHDVCSACHDTDNDCGVCHVNADDPMPFAPVEGKYEGFAHKVHGKVDCNQCHGDPAKAEPVIPGMTACQSCHLQESGPLECGECHLGESPKPQDHQLASWHQDHGIEASFRGDDCSMCHTQATCDECHQGENLYGSPHPPTWVFNHGIEANWSGECLSCHESRDECTSCHRQRIPVPHPFGAAFANTENGGAHVDEARAFIESCLACHDVGEGDPTCARCHE